MRVCRGILWGAQARDADSGRLLHGVEFDTTARFTDSDDDPLVLKVQYFGKHCVMELQRSEGSPLYTHFVPADWILHPPQLWIEAT